MSGRDRLRPSADAELGKRARDDRLHCLIADYKRSGDLLVRRSGCRRKAVEGCGGENGLLPAGIITLAWSSLSRFTEKATTNETVVPNTYRLRLVSVGE